MTHQPADAPGLLVLADGAQAAFVAGAVAELARRGSAWTTVRGAGLGAQVAVLAALGEAEEAERRWLRQAESGCPLLASLLSSARQRGGVEGGILVLADAHTLPGWLDPQALEEHLAPELAGLPSRLQGCGGRCAVPVDDVDSGSAAWIELSEVSAPDAAAALRSTCRFAGGWGPVSATGERAPDRRWGGVAAALRGGIIADGTRWDVVCGFPVPPVRRPGLGGSLLELVQRRDEVAAGAAVAAALDGGTTPAIAPSAASWSAWSERDGADVGTEYPLPWERNAELVRAAVAYGRWVARLAG